MPTSAHQLRNSGQCLDHLHDLLRQLAHRPLPDQLSESTDSTVRVVMPQPTWDHYVALAIDEILHWGGDSIQIRQRLGAVLDDLRAEVAPERAVVVVERQRRLDARCPARS